MKATHRITISISKEQHDEISRIASEHGISKSEVVREAFGNFLKNREREHIFNPRANLKGRSHPRNHLGDALRNPKSDELIAKYKEEHDGQD